MDTTTFNEIVDDQLQRCADVLVIKGAEYATEDRLHNFKVAAELQGVDILESVAGMMAKHTVSVYDMCGSTEPFALEQWDEKITDHMNYLILLRAAVIEQLSEQVDDVAAPIIDEIPSNAYEDLAVAINRVFKTTNHKLPGKAI
jgi:hypothetical protein